MSLRALTVGLVAFAGLRSASADTFGGFSGVDRPYLVNQDRVCTPIRVAGSAATGAPKCEKAAADAIAHLSIKPPLVQSGSKASFAATASGRTLTIARRAGGAVLTWDAPDPIVRVVELYASQYEDRVAVAYVTRRAGREFTDVIAFDLGQAQAAIRDGDAKSPEIVVPQIDSTRSVDTDRRADPSPPMPADSPALTKAVTAARAAPKAKAAAAWAAVLAIEPAHAEALYRRAAIDAAAKRATEALATLGTLAASPRPDAIEWRVEARFDPVFAALRADPKFRAAAGLDHRGGSSYERLMGFGGQWEQSGTSCDRPEVRLTTTRDRNFKLKVKTSCEGSVFDSSFKGTWRLAGDHVVLQLPNQGKITSADEAGCKFESFGDEDALRCSLGHDLDFVVLPTRR